MTAVIKGISAWLDAGDYVVENPVELLRVNSTGEDLGRQRFLQKRCATSRVLVRKSVAGVDETMEICELG